MKPVIFFVFLYLFLGYKADGQSWQRVQLEFPDTTAQDMLDGQLFGDTAIIMGSNGKTFYSYDFFESFGVDSTYNNNGLEALEFTSRDTGYIETGGVGGGLLISTNGGIDFRPYLNGASTGFGVFELMQLTHGDTGYIASTFDIPEVYRVGMNLHHSYTITPTFNNCNGIIQMRVTNDSTLYLLYSDELPMNNGSLYLIRSVDYGNTWQTLSKTGVIGNGDFRILDDTTIIVVGYQTIVKSKNGGYTFDTVLQVNNLSYNVNRFMKAVYFVNRDTGFVTWDSRLYRTYDAGATWVQTAFTLDANYLEGGVLFITASSSQKILLGCEFGVIYKTIDGGGIADVPNVAANPAFTISPNPTTGPIKITPPVYTAGNYAIDITNLLGQTVYKPYPVNNQIDVTNLAPGIYLLKLTTSSGYQTAKFVKQ